MTLALLGRGSLQGLTASGYALTPRFSPHVVRGCKLPRPKRARAISGPGGMQQFKMPAPSKDRDCSFFLLFVSFSYQQLDSVVVSILVMSAGGPWFESSYG